MYLKLQPRTLMQLLLQSSVDPGELPTGRGFGAVMPDTSMHAGGKALPAGSSRR